MKYFSVFLCQRCRESWHEILVRFSVCYVSQGLGVQIGKFHQNFTPQRCEEQKMFEAKFTLLGRGAEFSARLGAKTLIWKVPNRVTTDLLLNDINLGWRDPNGYQNKRVPKCQFFKTPKLAILYPSFLIPLWVLLKSHPSGYQNKLLPKCPALNFQKNLPF